MVQPDIEIGEEYIQFAHQVDWYMKQHLGEDTIIIDSYFGAPIHDETIKTLDPDLLLLQYKVLRTKVIKGLYTEPRRTYLIKQLDALALLVRFTLEESVPFPQRVKTGLDIDIVTVKSERIEELAEQAKRALRKVVLKGDLASMASRWRKRALIKGEEIVRLAEETAIQARQATQRVLFELPETEIIRFRPVEDAPWGAYNHYHGNYHGLIEVNVKLPKNKYAVWSWVTHETYPGHQTQLVLRELHYRRGELNIEGTASVINTPECTIAEGLAEAGVSILHQVRPLSELEEVSKILGGLRRAVGINALVMFQQQGRPESEVLEYLMGAGALEEEYARSQLPFIQDQMWGPYGFTYFVGAWLVRGFFEACLQANLTEEFVKALYHELHIPSTLQNRIRDLKLKLPPLTE